MHDLIIDFDK